MGESKTKPIKEQEVIELLNWLGINMNDWLEEE